MADFAITGSGFSFGITRDGIQLPRNYGSYNTAANAVDALEKRAKNTTRNCMRCTTSFTSTGPHHRLCNDCRKLSEGIM